MEVVENVKEYVLRFFLAAEKLHVINEQHIHHLIEVTEIVYRVISNRINELVGKFF